MFETKSLEEADEKIVKLGENKVAIQKVLYDKKGKEVVIYQEVFGEKSIEEALEMQDKVIKNLKENALKKEEDMKDKLLQVKDKLNKS